MTSELQKKVERAIRLLQAASQKATEAGQPLEVAYSGGKDSDVILELARMAGVPFRAIYKNTTIDPPGTIAHVRGAGRGVEILQPKMNFRQIIERKGLPTRWRRFCCAVLKEYPVLDNVVIGVRRSESRARAERYHEPEVCRVYNKKKDIKVRQYLPILEWTADDVAEFITERGIKCHPLYYDEQGAFHAERRLGCIGCPLSSRKRRIEEFQKYPGMVRFYIKGAQTYLDTHPNCGVYNYFRDAYEWFTQTLICDSLIEFRQRYGPDSLFGSIDFKQYLEQLFSIKL